MQVTARKPVTDPKVYVVEDEPEAGTPYLQDLEAEYENAVQEETVAQRVAQTVDEATLDTETEPVARVVA